MPLETVLVVSAVIAGFVIFGLTLAFADLSTAHLRKKRQIPAE